MPRIAAALGGLVLIVFSIGFNIARYPKVRAMVGPPSPLSQPDPSSESATTSESVTAPPVRATNTAPRDSPQSIPEASPSEVADGAALCLNSPTGACPVDPAAQTNADASWSKEDAASSWSVSSGEYAPDDAAATTSGRPETDGGLVPLIRPADKPDPHQQAAGDDAVRRLPPVDPEDPTAEDPYVRRAAGDPIPFYPSTGYE